MGWCVIGFGYIESNKKMDLEKVKSIVKEMKK